MCGIFGYISERAIADDLADRVIRSLSHRGPDGAGQYCAALPDARRLLLVHTRLSIIDIEGGVQPMWDADRRWVTVFNGELYNYVELRGELLAAGCRFVTHSDTEVLVTAISHWGVEQALPRFNGMFAFAAWCRETGELVLARDRFGIKPLYYFQRGRSFGFCSELGTLLRSGLVDKRISAEALELYLAQYSLPAPWSMIDGVMKLRPGYYCRIQDDIVTHTRYWTPRWDQPVIGSMAEACEEFDRVVTRSIKRQLRSDVPVGISLSGGLDSSSLLAYAAQELAVRPACYTLSFPDPSWDESPLSRAMAGHCGAPVRVAEMKAPELLAQMRHVLGRYGEPMGDWSVGLVAFVSQLARPEHKVLLIGTGGDELFAGYPTVNAAAFARLYRKLPGVVHACVEGMAGLLPDSDKNMSLSFKLQRFLNGAHAAPELGHLKYKEIFDDDERHALLGYRPDHGLPDLLDNIDLLKAPRDEERLLWIDVNTFMQSNVLAGFDAASMAHGVEMRVPLLDNDMYDFSLQLARSVKFSLTTTKRLIREAVGPRVPACVRKAPKRGFVYPADLFFRHDLRGQVEMLLDSERISALKLNSETVSGLWHEHLQGRKNRGRQLSSLLSLLIWHEEVIA